MSVDTAPPSPVFDPSEGSLDRAIGSIELMGGTLVASLAIAGLVDHEPIQGDYHGSVSIGEEQLDFALAKDDLAEAGLIGIALTAGLVVAGGIRRLLRPRK